MDAGVDYRDVTCIARIVTGDSARTIAPNAITNKDPDPFSIGGARMETTQQTTRYRFYLGDGPHTNPQNVERITSDWYDGATLYWGVGLWEGETEPSVTIEVLDSDHNPTHARLFADYLRRRFEQTCVLYTAEPVNVTSVTAEGEGATS